LIVDGADGDVREAEEGERGAYGGGPSWKFGFIVPVGFD
jgi:hypothetical protein